MSVQDCINTFEDLTCRRDAIENCSQMITRFVPRLITGSYDLDAVEKAFDVVLKIDLTFKKLVNAKARCTKCERYGHYNYQCPLKSRHVSIVSSDDVDDLKVVKDIHVPSTTTSIIENISVGSDTPILDEGHASYRVLVK